MSVPAGVMIDQLSGAGPDKIQRILAMAQTPEQRDMIAQQLAQANYLRSTPNAEGRHAGRVYVAPNPMEVVGNTLLQAQGMSQGAGAQASMADIMRQNSQGRKDYLDILRMMYGNRPGGAPMSGAAALSAGGTDSVGNGTEMES